MSKEIVKLEEIAHVIGGANISKELLKSSGDVLVIGGRNIIDGKPVDLDALWSDQLGESAAYHAEEELELKCAVLCLAEPEAVPGVGVPLGFDVGNAVPVPADGYRLRDAVYAKRAAGGRKTTAKDQLE